jgi:hypothetical protein
MTSWRALSLVVVLTLAATSLGAQGSPAAEQLVSNADMRFTSYAEDATARAQLLTREIDIFDRLVDVALHLPTGTPGNYDSALKDLENIHDLAVAEPPLPEPVPTLISEFSQPLASPTSRANPASVRADVSAAVAHYQTFLIEQTEALHREALLLQHLEATAARVGNEIRKVAVRGLEEAINAQRVLTR